MAVGRTTCNARPRTISAFATVGLSTGITADLRAAGQVLLVLLMYIGRIGPLWCLVVRILAGGRREYLRFPAASTRFPENRASRLVLFTPPATLAAWLA
jgi:hypothetical protein